MSDKSESDVASRTADKEAHVDASRGAPSSKLALAALIISVLAVVARCEVQQQRQGEPGHGRPSLGSAANTAVVDKLRELQAMSASIAAKARDAQPGALTAVDCDRSTYERFLAVRNSLATQLDASAPAIGQAQYFEINNQLVALAMAAAEASETLAAVCAAAPRKPF